MVKCSSNTVPSNPSLGKDIALAKKSGPIRRHRSAQHQRLDECVRVGK